MAKYTSEFGTVQGYNSPQPGMTQVPGKSNLYYGNDGYIYNMTDGSRRPGNPPKEKPKAPPPAPAPSGGGGGSKITPPKPETTPAPPTAPEEVTQGERDQITPPASGLEDTIKTEPAAPPPDYFGSTPPPAPNIGIPSLLNKKKDEKRGSFLTRKT